MPQNPTSQAVSTRWSLRVVRGRDVGRVFSVAEGETVLGGEPGGADVLNLREQEATSARRMAGRQALVMASGPELVIRDLDSPGGTFVNRQRLLSGQSRRLQPGDQIQLAGVQLQVDDSRPAAARPEHGAPAGQGPVATTSSHTAAGQLPAPFLIDQTVACRTWDDFLVVAAQRWTVLRAELESGRLAGYLQGIARADLAPHSPAGRSADEQLDLWLGRLPVRHSSEPELDVLPDRIEVQAPGGGTVRRELRITNVGYRLLRSTIRVQPANTSWIALGLAGSSQPFSTIDATELAIELRIPESIGESLHAEIVVESNGGTRRVPVSIIRPEVASEPNLIEAPGTPVTRLAVDPFRARLAQVAPPARIAAGVALALGFRGMVAASGWLPVGVAGASPLEPRLPAVAALFAVLGLIASLTRLGRGRPVEQLEAAFASALGGVVIAVLSHAIVRSFEQLAGPWTPSYAFLGLLWAGLGAAAAILSLWVVPFRGRNGEVSP